MKLNSKISGDLFGGLTAAIVALPLALAFGVQSGMGAIAGLYGAIALGIFAAMFGGTSTQISGPTGPMAVVASVVVAGEIALYGSLEKALPYIVVTFVLAGLLQIMMGVLKIGQYIRYMPYPVISGFMSGIGLIIIIMQIFPFFGLESPKKIVDILSSIGSIFSNINYAALFLAASTIAIIYLFPKLTKKIPSTLVALVVMSVVSVVFEMDVPIIGSIPQGLPEFHWEVLSSFDYSDPLLILIPALTLAALGAIDSLLTSVVADNMTKTEHNSNKELVGQGIGNTLAGFIGGLPGAGATMRTVVNINAGGRTKLSGVFHGAVLVVILLGAGTLAEMIPLSVLAGILITVGIGIIDYKSVKNILHIPRSDAAIMVIVLLLTVLVDLLQAVAVGFVLSTIWFMKQMGESAAQKANGWMLQQQDEELEDEKSLPKEIKEHIYIQHFHGPIFFGFTSSFKAIIKSLPNVDAVVFRFEDVPYIDQSGLYSLEETFVDLKSRNTTVYLCGLEEQPLSMLTKMKIIPNLLPSTHVSDSFETTKELLKK